MSTEQISISEFVEKAVESILKRDSKKVIADLDKLPQKHAIAATAYIIDHLHGRNDYAYHSFLRALGTRI